MKTYDSYDSLSESEDELEVNKFDFKNGLAHSSTINSERKCTSNMLSTSTSKFF